MRLVETLVVDDDADTLDAHLAFHLAAGVDLVLVASTGADVAQSVERQAGDGRIVRVEANGGTETQRRTHLARIAASEHGADWILDAGADEFWWPRGESLKDALAAMPQRYGIVQGLVRLFVPSPGDGAFAERMTRRRSLEPPAEPEPLESALRPLYRADPELTVGAGSRGRVPLRAWYPFEVLTFPIRDAVQAERRARDGRPVRSSLEAAVLEAAGAGRLEASLEALADEPHLVEDTRLRDALRALEAGEPLSFRVPDVVDDAAYAVECAAVGEVDLPRLEAYVADLEARVIALEQRLWPRVVRRLERLVSRRGA